MKKEILDAFTQATQDVNFTSTLPNVINAASTSEDSDDEWGTFFGSGYVLVFDNLAE